jgi:hypothetical protein
MDYVSAASAEHRRLDEYAQVRLSELTRIFRDEIQLLVAYEQLLCRATVILGAHEPADAADRACRDLIADGFDALYVARRVVSEGYASAAWPLMRRAFESATLLEYFVLLPGEANRWTRGARITHRRVRKYLNEHPIQVGGTTISDHEKTAMKELYSQFSEATHPNRGSIPTRFLGEPNQFVLGPTGMPDPLVVGQYMLSLIDLWFFFAATVSYAYRDILPSADSLYGKDYHKLAARAREVSDHLQAGWTALWQAEYGNML